jgi:hypothetical protein
MSDLWKESFSRSSISSAGLSHDSQAREEEKGFKLIVNFKGICCFLPASDGLSMAVFLVNEGKKGDRKEIPAHSAAVRFPLARVRGISDVLENLNAVYLPANEEIRFTFDGDKEEVRNLAIAGFRNGAIAEEPLKSPTESLWWVLSVGDACRKCSLPEPKIDDLFNDKILDDDHAKVLSARLLLTRGWIKATQHIRHGDKNYVVWRLRPEIESNSDKYHMQFAASVVQLECLIPAESLRITARDLRSNDERQVVELVPGGDGKIEIDVLNEESDEILDLELGGQGKIEVGVLRGQDRIFKSVLKLLANPPESFDFPVPIAARFLPPRDPKERDGAVRTAYPCSPVRVGG